MLRAIKEANKMVDDMRAAQEDIESGDPALQKHGLRTLAKVAEETAARAESIGLGRVAEYMREQADNAREGVEEIERNEDDRARWRKNWDRAMKRSRAADAKRREDLQREAETGDQPDMFNVWTKDGRGE